MRSSLVSVKDVLLAGVVLYCLYWREGSMELICSRSLRSFSREVGEVDS